MSSSNIYKLWAIIPVASFAYDEAHAASELRALLCLVYADVAKVIFLQIGRHLTSASQNE